MADKFIGWFLGLLMLVMALILVLGPHVGIATEDASPPACHSHAC